MKIPRGATLHRFKTGGWRFAWGRILLWRTSFRAERGITRTKAGFWLDLWFLHLHVDLHIEREARQ